MISVATGTALALIGILAIGGSTITRTSEYCSLPPVSLPSFGCGIVSTTYPVVPAPFLYPWIALAVVPLLALVIPKASWASLGASVSLASLVVAPPLFIGMWSFLSSLPQTVSAMAWVVFFGACANILGSLLLAQAKNSQGPPQSSGIRTTDWSFWAIRSFLVGADGFALAVMPQALFLCPAGCQTPAPTEILGPFWIGVGAALVVLGSVPVLWSLFAAPKYGSFWHPNRGRGHVT
jgi:hypothetical protein